MLHVILHNPKIPPNTGNIIRLTANTGFQLHLIEPLGFDLEEKQLRRAGLDYHDLANVKRYASYSDFLLAVQPDRVFAVTTKGKTRYCDVRYAQGDAFLFGSETNGLTQDVIDTVDISRRIRIPMKPNNRSLNLSNSVSIVVYEAWQQLLFVDGK